MTLAGSSKKQTLLVKTSRVLGELKRQINSDKNTSVKQPSAKSLSKLKKILTALESGHMPFPEIAVMLNGYVMLTWSSLLREIIMVVDDCGDVQFTTSLKKINTVTAEVVDRLDSEGFITDLISIDHIMVWFCSDVSHQA
jgi:hypothetical protein